MQDPNQDGYPEQYLVTRIGFWGFLTLIRVRYTPKPYSNYSGPYITLNATDLKALIPKKLDAKAQLKRSQGGALKVNSRMLRENLRPCVICLKIILRRPTPNPKP